MVTQRLFNIFQRLATGFKDFGMDEPNTEEAKDAIADKQTTRTEEVQQGWEGWQSS